MKRKILLLALLSAIIAFSVLSSAISCTIQPGPGGPYFSVTVHNQHGWHTLRIYKNGVWFGTALAGDTYTNSSFIATDRVKIYNADALIFLQDASLNTEWMVNAYYTFTYTGGATIAVSAILGAER